MARAFFVIETASHPVAFHSAISPGWRVRDELIDPGVKKRSRCEAPRPRAAQRSDLSFRRAASESDIYLSDSRATCPPSIVLHNKGVAFGSDAQSSEKYSTDPPRRARVFSLTHPTTTAVGRDFSCHGDLEQFTRYVSEIIWRSLFFAVSLGIRRMRRGNESGAGSVDVSILPSRLSKKRRPPSDWHVLSASIERCRANRRFDSSQKRSSVPNPLRRRVHGFL